MLYDAIIIARHVAAMQCYMLWRSDDAMRCDYLLAMPEFWRCLRDIPKGYHCSDQGPDINFHLYAKMLNCKPQGAPLLFSELGYRFLPIRKC